LVMTMWSPFLLILLSCLDNVGSFPGLGRQVPRFSMPTIKGRPSDSRRNTASQLSHVRHRHFPPEQQRWVSMELYIRRIDANENPTDVLPRRHLVCQRFQLLSKILISIRGKIACFLRRLLERTTIYVLECEGGKYYIGMTQHRRRRFRQHFESSGSAWTRKYPPQKILQEYRRVPSRFALGMEAQITAQLMWEYGVNNVRGAMFSQTRLFHQEDIDALVPFLGHFNGFSYVKVRQVLEESLPLRLESIQCFRCGKYGHMMADCKSKKLMTRKKCRACGKFGHIAADCPKVGFERSSQDPTLDLDGW
jgi:predicted GIY-YIG superfamily endonuclease